MARHYEIIRHNAQDFADERNRTVYICKAKRKTDYKIVFSPDQLTANYEIYEEVNPTIGGNMKMKRTFTVDASRKIKAATEPVKAAEDKVDPRVDQVADLQDKVEEDFSYLIAGIERLVRENQFDDALELLNTLSDTLDSAIGIVGDDFESNDNLGGE